MLTWICPLCGRECQPDELDCLSCNPAAAPVAAVPVAAAAVGASGTPLAGTALAAAALAVLDPPEPLMIDALPDADPEPVLPPVASALQPSAPFGDTVPDVEPVLPAVPAEVRARIAEHFNALQPGFDTAPPFSSNPYSFASPSLARVDGPLPEPIRAAPEPQPPVHHSEVTAWIQTPPEPLFDVPTIPTDAPQPAWTAPPLTSSEPFAASALSTLAQVVGRPPEPPPAAMSSFLISPFDRPEPQDLVPVPDSPEPTAAELVPAAGLEAALPELPDEWDSALWHSALADRLDDVLVPADPFADPLFPPEIGLAANPVPAVTAATPAPETETTEVESVFERESEEPTIKVPAFVEAAGVMPADPEPPTAEPAPNPDPFGTLQLEPMPEPASASPAPFAVDPFWEEPAETLIERPELLSTREFPAVTGHQDPWLPRTPEPDGLSPETAAAAPSPLAPQPPATPPEDHWSRSLELADPLNLTQQVPQVNLYPSSTPVSAAPWDQPFAGITPPSIDMAAAAADPALGDLPAADLPVPSPDDLAAPVSSFGAPVESGWGHKAFPLDNPVFTAPPAPLTTAASPAPSVLRIAEGPPELPPDHWSLQAASAAAGTPDAPAPDLLASVQELPRYRPEPFQEAEPAAPAPPPRLAAEPPIMAKRRTGTGVWVLALAVLPILALAGWFALQMAGNSKKTNEIAPIPSSARAMNPDHPLARHLEIVGFRVTPGQGVLGKVRFLLINHSSSEISNLTISITLKTDAGDEAMPARSFTIAGPIGPYESTEVEPPGDVHLKNYVDFSDWRRLRPEFTVQ